MESLLEVLFPLIIAGVYFFGNILSKKKDKSAAPSPLNQEEPSPAELEVQEQIRRKIEARKASYESTESELLTKTEQDNPHSPEDLVSEQMRERRGFSRVERRKVVQPRDIDCSCTKLQRAKSKIMHGDLLKSKITMLKRWKIVVKG